jgi:DNA-binding MarR family transcriptional regulator
MAHRQRAHELLATVGLHPGQEFLLAALDVHGPVAVGDLADLLGVEQPTVTKMLRRMGPTGWVERHTDPEDGRRVLVELTATGRAVHERARAVWAQLDAELTVDLTPDEVATLAALLRRVRGSLIVDGRC